MAWDQKINLQVTRYMACIIMLKKPAARYGRDQKRYGVPNVEHRILPKKTRFARDAVDIFVRMSW